MKDKVFISFSGGKTSAYMTKRLLQEHPDKEFTVLFANTGEEHEATLEFVEKCDKEFNFGVVWVEAKVNPERGKGTTHTVVDFESASRNGEPFESVIQKYGIPNKAYNHCTRELKLQPMLSYIRSFGWKNGQYSTAVGIRFDELDRMSKPSMEKGVIYPCVGWKITKQHVLDWWAMQPFNLEIPEHLGNCKWCWKKSERKLLTIMQSNPEFFNFPKRMESTYSMAGGERKDGEQREPRVFFRENKSTDDLIQLSTKPFKPYVDGHYPIIGDELDIGGGCGDGCEIGTDN